MFELPNPPSTPAARLRMALAMFGDGLEMTRQRLRREFPAAGEDEIRARLIEWLRKRPGAELGDADGRPRDWAPTC